LTSAIPKTRNALVERVARQPESPSVERKLLLIRGKPAPLPSAGFRIH